MNDPESTTIELQSLIDRMMAGDEQARVNLVERAYQRVERIVRRTFHQKYLRLANQHDTASIINETYLRLSAALEKVQASGDPNAPMDVTGFFRLVASKAHQVCLDLIRKNQVRVHKGGQATGGGTNAPPHGPVEQLPQPEGDDPSDLALWTEFHERIDSLQPEERDIFQLCYYLGMKRGEAAQVLGIHPKEASRRWLRVTAQLQDVLFFLDDDQ